VAAKGSNECGRVMQRVELHIRASQEFKRTGQEPLPGLHCDTEPLGLCSEDAEMYRGIAVKTRI